MRIHHAGLVCRSEANADRFYQDLLGLKRIRSFTVSSDLSSGLFGFNESFQALTYRNDDKMVEIFIVPEMVPSDPHLHHTGLEVDDRKKFVEKCKGMGVQVMEVPKGEKTITMIRDFDGNLFEISEKE